ncbi:MAG TPA: hypothetical protein VJ276_06385 [Thermoanaerobaculia bacterium]|nr:hypothetical protein [Thermoanaerobaculia bacterium]
MSLRLASSLAAAAALFAVAPQATPIDRALPFVGLVIGLVAMLADRWMPAILMAVPLLAVAAVSLQDEYARLLAYGLITAIAFSAALFVAPLDRWRATAFVIATLLLLRWIPPRHVLRELIVMAGAVAIVWAFRRPSQFAVGLAVAVALVTPGIPMRTAVLPFAVAGSCWLLVAGYSRLGVSASNQQPATSNYAGALLTALLLTFFPWSGVVARATPMRRLLARAEKPRHAVHIALAPGESTTLDVPPGMHSLIVSASNASRMTRGALLGDIDGRPIRIGDVADWGARRREHSYDSRNPLPRDPAGKLRAYGYDAWIDGAGRIALPHAERITVTADAKLNKVVRLQIEAFE